MELRKATRQRVKLRVGMAGPSGSGKTYSALKLASGMADWEKIALIDTENGSGELYSDLGPYNVITLSAPFTPERYIEAIDACEAAGMEVIIIDSVTHEWDGDGGLLDVHSKMIGNSFTNWSKITPRHNKFIQAILQSPCHMITTVRKKQDYDMTQSEGKTKVVKVGLKEVQREGFEYELTLNFELDIRHMATAGKDRTGMFMDKAEFVISKETGMALKEWCESGIEPIKPVEPTPAPKAAAPAAPAPTARPHMKELQTELKARGATDAVSALAILNEGCGTKFTDFMFSEEEASHALITLMQAPMPETKPSKKKSSK